MSKKTIFLILILSISALSCAKSISLNSSADINKFSLGQVEVSVQAASQNLGSTTISASSIPETVVEKIPTEISKKNNAELVLDKNVEVQAPNKPKVSNLSNLNISQIGLNTQVDFATVKDIDTLDEKLLYNPLIESVLSSDFCTLGNRTYVYGHSEPSKAGTGNLPGTYIFKDLDKLSVGQEIDSTNLQGQSCKYKISEIFTVTTNSEDQVSDSDYAKLFYPEIIQNKSLLTLQTCIKGSSTVRLLIRAISV